MNNRLHIENVDILDGTPLIDIKPYISDIDVHPADHFGWFDKAKGSVQHKKSDNRFEKESLSLILVCFSPKTRSKHPYPFICWD